MNNSNMPVMPLTEDQIDRSERAHGYEGLTKREYFAGLAMQGLLAGPHAEADCGIEGLAHDAVLAANYLLKKLERTQ